MRTLRGRPSNISESGVVYLDSDGEESDISDSDVEPVFFPAAGFDFNGEVFEVQDFAPVTDGEDDDSDDSSLFEVVPRHEQQVFEFVGGTVQVRHIVNENYAQLQQELRERNLEQEGTGSGNTPGTSGGVVGTGTGSSATPRREVAVVAPFINEAAITISTGSAAAMGDNNAPESRAVLEGVDPEPENEDRLRPTREVVAASSSAKQERELDDADVELPAPNSNLGGESSSHYRDESTVSNSNRLSLKRKEPDGNGDEGSGTGLGSGEGSQTDEGQSTVGKHNKKTLKNSESSDDEEDDDNVDDEEETCNRMVSEDEEEEETGDTFRGDRIGSTVYSESHVLTILMKWVEAFPSYSVEKLMAAQEDENVSEEDIEKLIFRLNTEFDEQMSLLWDMSAEPDVMNFLVENKIFALVRNTIENSVCNRLMEVSLGILANVISEPSIIEDFTVHDSSLQIVEKVVELCAKVTDVAVLTQAFCVLRRIVWYLRNVGAMKKWTELLMSPGFLECSNFIMSSSTNALLLGNVIMLFFTFLDTFRRDNLDDDSDSDSDVNFHNSSPLQSSSTKITKLQQLSENYEPFCAAGFVPAICEGLKELMKNPKPPNKDRMLTSTRDRPVCPSTSGGQTDEHCLNADEIDVPIPEGHVQQSILKGFSTLALLQKASSGRHALEKHAPKVIAVLMDFYRNFAICTEAVSRSNSLEYFALSLHLLSFCHCHLDAANTDAILNPVSTASKLMSEEERDKNADVIRVQLKDGIEFESVSYIALVVHEYLAAVAEKFGPDCALKARRNASHAKFFDVLDKVVAKFTKESGTI